MFLARICFGIDLKYRQYMVESIWWPSCSSRPPPNLERVNYHLAPILGDDRSPRNWTLSCSGLNAPGWGVTCLDLQDSGRVIT